MTEPTPDVSDDAVAHRRRRRRVTAAIVLTAVAAGVAVFLVLWNRDASRPVKVSDARRNYRATSTTTTGPAGGGLQPSPGVYTYAGSGTDHISTPPKSADEGPVIPGTVTLGGDGCWTFRVDYSTSHWQTWEYCANGGRLLERGGQSFQRWDFVAFDVTTTTTSTCEPPSVVLTATMRAGDSWRQSCTSTSTSVSGTAVSAGRMTYVGRARLTVGRRKVDTYHFRQERTMHGSQTGTQVSDLWFAPNGLPVRNERRMSVDSDSPIGSVTYTERGHFSLTSLTPRT
jgi:hypothetical protein